MTSIELPAGLVSISANAFYGCSSMTSIELPAGLTSIGESAFYECSSLASIALPAGLTSIAANAFYGCSSLTTIELTTSCDLRLSSLDNLRSAGLPPSTILRYAPHTGCSPRATRQAEQLAR